MAMMASMTMIIMRTLKFTMSNEYYATLIRNNFTSYLNKIECDIDFCLDEIKL